MRTPADSRLWNELIQRHHYLGYRPLSGAQMRYLVWSGDGRLLAALGFGTSAWHLKPRDRYIGWNDGQRRRGLPRIVNNARFILAPRCALLKEKEVIKAGMTRHPERHQEVIRKLEARLAQHAEERDG